MAKYDYNIIVIGGGSAGLVASYIGAAVGSKILLIEKEKMGGDCLNTGCVPSKALIRSAKILADAKSASKFGFKHAKIEFDFADIMQRVHDIIKKIEPHDSIERYQKLGVDCLIGNAKIISKNVVQVQNKIYRAKTIIVATGAGPLIPNIEGLDKIDYLTSDNIWQLKELPKKLVVLGGGPIGTEMAQAFLRLGSDVTLIEMAPQILIREDKEVIELVSNSLEKEGMTILTNHKAKSFQEGKIICDHMGQNITIKFDKILIALGRQANTKNFGLEELDIKLRKNGTIESDIFLRTNIKNIYVCGDVTGPYQFTHIAAHQAWYACVNSLFSPFKKFKVNYDVIPWATFTDPEIGRVGLNEKDAIAQNIPYEVTNYGINDLDRAITDSNDYGFVKVLTKPGTDKILGATIVGAHAGDLITEYILAMKNNIGLNKILGTIHIYPTMAEANKYVAGNWKKAHIPKLALRLLKIFHQWRLR